MEKSLTAYHARRMLRRVTPHISDGFKRLVTELEKILPEDGKLAVKSALDALFPASTGASANAALNRLISIINDAAHTNGIPMEVKITSAKRLGAEKRQLWIEGRIEPEATPITGDIAAIPSGLVQTQQTGMLVGAPVVILTFNEHETKAVRKIFGLGQDIRPDASGVYPVTDLGIHGGNPVKHIISGQGRLDANDAAREAIERYSPCAAILAVGIAFGIDDTKQSIGDVLISKFIRDYEHGRLNPDGSIYLRAGEPEGSEMLLRRVTERDHANSGSPNWPKLHTGILLCGDKLVDNRPFRDSLLKVAPEAVGGEMEGAGIQYAAKKTNTPWLVIKGISDWADGGKRTSTKERDQRVAAENAALVTKAILDFGPLRPGKNNDGPLVPAQPCPSPILRDRSDLPLGMLRRDAKAKAASLQKDSALSGDSKLEPEGLEVLPYLHEWIDDLKSPPVLALLAEYGMGKTITCQQLAHELDERRREDSRRPMPLYIDLRHVTRLKERVPTLEETLVECMARGWRSRGEGGTPTIAEFYEWLDQGAVVIIDGLDEVLVHLNAADGQTFTNNLLKLLPDARTRLQASGKALKLKIIIACRTHYFPTLRAQQSHFTQQERGEVDADQYRALLLLPWTEEQVRAYIKSALPDADLDQIIEMFRSVHNLEELAARPFTLRLLAEFVPQLERMRADGNPVSGVTLYRAMVERWLDRDNGKHHILPEHKMRLAGHLAAFLWKSGKGVLSANELQSWFHQWRESSPDLLRYRSLDIEKLEEDLRTATFLTRKDDDDGSVFSFAHRSLLEFFLADYLLTAAREKSQEKWALPVVSIETLDFLGQMLIAEKPNSLVETLQSWRRPYRAQVSELLLSYALRAAHRSWPMPILHGFDLAGANLRGWRFDGRNGRLNFGPASFAGCDLRDAEFWSVGLQGADFSDTWLDYCEFLSCNLTGATFACVRLTACVFRQCWLENTSWRGAQGYRPQFLLSQSMIDYSVINEILDQPVIACVGRTSRPSELDIGVKLGHSLTVSACGYSPDGRRIVSGSYDGTLRIWNAESGEIIAVLEGHFGWTTACSYSPDGRRIVSGSYDGTLRIWDAESSEIIATLEGHSNRVNACSYSPDGRRIVSGAYDRTLRIWDVESGEVVTVLDAHSGGVYTCSYSPDGRRIVSGGFDSVVRVWDANSGEPITALEGQSGEVYTCSYSPDGSRIVSGGDSGTLWICNAENGEAITVLEGHSGGINACSYSPDGRRIVSSSNDRSVRIWDAESGEIVAVLEGHSDWVTVCSYSPNGCRIVSGGDDRTVRIWDADSGEIIVVLQGNSGGVNACGYSPDGRRIVSGGNYGVLCIWDAESGDIVTMLEGHSGWVRACSYSPNGRRIVSSGFDGTLRLWDAESGEIIAVLEGHPRWVDSCGYSPDGRRIVSGGYDGSLQIWDAESGEIIATLEGHSEGIKACSYSPDGRRIVSGCCDEKLRIWDAESGETITVLEGHSDWVNACSYSPDGSRIVSGGYDGTLRIWDAESGEAITVLEGHSGGVNTCSYSPDGRRIVSGGYDGTLRIWDAKSGEAITVLEGHSDWVNACSYSPDGSRIVSGCNNGMLLIWNAQTCVQTRIHCQWASKESAFGYAVWEPETNRMLSHTKDAWRIIDWYSADRSSGFRRFPLDCWDVTKSQSEAA